MIVKNDLLGVLFKQEEAFLIAVTIAVLSFFWSFIAAFFLGCTNKVNHYLYAKYFFLHLRESSIKLFLNAFWEEVVFRFIPIVAAYYWFNLGGWSLVTVCVISSFVFAVLHEFSIQAVIKHFPVGFLLCVLFIKTGGLSGVVLPSLMMCIVAHFTINLLAVSFNYLTEGSDSVSKRS